MKAAVVQINSGSDRARNIETAGNLVRAAADDGAQLVVLPEKWSLLGDGRALAEGAESLDGEAITAARNWATDLGIHLLAGSFTETAAQGLPTNTSVLISPTGELVAEYRKLHMFDVEAGGVEYRESEHEQAGEELAVADLDRLRIGLTVCYDLRFPELFRALLDRGANAFTVPSAFTSATGRDHWEVLLRARAIENQAFVLAANQVGTAEPSYDSWGHSMIVDPWGEVLAEVETGEGYAVAGLDLERQAEVRRELPAIEHRRPEIFSEGVTHGS
ncbi:MAG: carbon-nitrogen hydrolase family protein [Solirubrobacterales bacterium]|nr:carbon-nitrogen hydrolase family protein [Solirubrobacterales bacterium]OJU93802.1 MAG: hydrolase [Solirubrobacterales bacterium 67-14]